MVCDKDIVDIMLKSAEEAISSGDPGHSWHENVPPENVKAIMLLAQNLMKEINDRTIAIPHHQDDEVWPEEYTEHGFKTLLYMKKLQAAIEKQGFTISHE